MAAEDAEHTEHLGRLVAEWQLRADMVLDGGGGTTAMCRWREPARRSAGAEPAEAHDAPLRTCLPTPRRPGPWPGPTPGTRLGPRTACTRPWRPRSGRRRGRSSPPGRRALGPRPCTVPGEPTPSDHLPLTGREAPGPRAPEHDRARRARGRQYSFGLVGVTRARAEFGRRNLVVAHRGASSSTPENTIPAFEEAARAGADVIELDVRLTRDGVPVVLHDPDVSATDPQAALDYVRQDGHDFVLPHAMALLDAGEGLVEEAHAEGIRVGTWTVDDEDTLSRLYAWDVDAVASNDPATAV